MENKCARKRKGDFFYKYDFIQIQSSFKVDYISVVLNLDFQSSFENSRRFFQFRRAEIELEL